MLLNLSNHPYNTWTKEQLETALKEYGQIKDIYFPEINPNWGSQEVLNLAEEFMQTIFEIHKTDNISAVHLMGELTFCTALSILLKKHNINCIVSTTHRIVSFSKQGIKESEFSFCRFREYIIP